MSLNISISSAMRLLHFFLGLPRTNLSWTLCAAVPVRGSIGRECLAYERRIALRRSAAASTEKTPTKTLTGLSESARSCGNGRCSWQYCRHGGGSRSDERTLTRKVVRVAAKQPKRRSEKRIVKGWVGNHGWRTRAVQKVAKHERSLPALDDDDGEPATPPSKGALDSPPDEVDDRGPVFLRRVSARRAHQPGFRCLRPMTGDVSGASVPPSLLSSAEVW